MHRISMNVAPSPVRTARSRLKSFSTLTRVGFGSGLAAAALLLSTAHSSTAATNVVRMVGTSFQPQFLTNNPGDTILWTNTSSTVGHNVISSNNTWAASALFTAPGTFRVTFTTPGTYGYFCGPHRNFGMTGIIYVRAAANQQPVVAITNPASGLTLAAPATVTLRATAADPDGTVGNVQFFSGETHLGTATALPYSFTVPNLAAGNYSFTAKASDNAGLSATSAAVNVSVVTPAPIRFQPSVPDGTGGFPLTLEVTPGLRYEILSSTDLPNWVGFTNFTATQPIMSFSVPTVSPDRRLFRARLLPNP
jgi:chitinase